MDHIGAAIFLTQPIIDRPGIEEQKVALPSDLSHFEQHIGGKVDNEKRDALIGELHNDIGWIGSGFDPCLLQREMLIEKLAGRIVIFKRQTHAG